MEIIKIILLTLILIFLILQFFKKKEPKNEQKTEEIVQIPVEMTKEEVQKATDLLEKKEKYEKTKKAFNNLMNYDEKIALKKEEE